MNLFDIVKRTPVPEPWDEGEKIPWNEPGFSRRMREYHLSQDHDLASRRFSIIDKHVKFIDGMVGGPTKVLDLGCGPGFYASRLTSLGYGEGYGLAMMVYGEFNVFKEEDIRAFLRMAYDSLEKGGVFIAEPHTFDAVKSFGEAPPSWYSGESMLFSDEPHLALMECFWNESHRVTINRYIIVDAASAEATLHASTMQAYTNEEYEALLRDAGFSEIELHDSLTGDEEDRNEQLMVLVGRK